MARTGKKKQAFFRIVVADKRRAVTSKFIEILGNYNPHAKKLDIKEDRLNEYFKNGAQPSNTVAKLLKKEGIKLPDWVRITERNRPAKKAEEAPAEEAKKEAPAEEAAEATDVPAPEVKEAPAEAKEEVSEEAGPVEEVKEEVKE